MLVILNKSTLINYLVKFLNPKLKVSLIGVKLLNIITVCINIINDLYNNLLCLTLNIHPNTLPPNYLRPVRT